jgi:3-hydroxy-9,10-secoandrosta-1,3,5(10)-triene-9,17-dione monooxygenase
MYKVVTVDPEAVTREQLLNCARDLAPALRERSERCEKLRRVPDETVADFIRTGLIRATQPVRFGGSEIAWDTLCEITEILSEACGSQAWIQRIMADHAQMVATFPEQAQHDVWGQNNDALVSASFDPVGRAERTRGGYLLTGTHGFSSGIDHASWMICGGHILDGERKDGPHFFLVPKSDARVIDDWETMGLAGTGSKSFELDRVFVPEHRFLDGRLAAAGKGPGTAMNPSYVYRVPRGSGVTTSGFAALNVGMARGVLSEWLKMTGPRKSRGVSIGQLATTQEIAARSAGEIDAASALYMSSLSKAMWQLRTGEEVNAIDRLTAKRDATLAAQICLRAGTRLFNAAGGRALFMTGHLQRQYRNLLGAASHHALSWEAAAVEYGRAILEAHGAERA